MKVHIASCKANRFKRDAMKRHESSILNNLSYSKFWSLSKGSKIFIFGFVFCFMWLCNEPEKYTYRLVESQEYWNV